MILIPVRGVVRPGLPGKWTVKTTATVAHTLDDHTVAKGQWASGPLVVGEDSSSFEVGVPAVDEPGVVPADGFRVVVTVQFTRGDHVTWTLAPSVAQAETGIDLSDASAGPDGTLPIAPVVLGVPGGAAQLGEDGKLLAAQLPDGLPGGGGAVDLTGYATETFVGEQIAAIVLPDQPGDVGADPAGSATAAQQAAAAYTDAEITALGLGTAAQSDAADFDAAGAGVAAQQAAQTYTDTAVSGEQVARQAAIAQALEDFIGAAPAELDTWAEAIAQIQANEGDLSTLVAGLAGKQAQSATLELLAALTTATFGRNLLTMPTAEAVGTALELGSAAVETAAALRARSSHTGTQPATTVNETADRKWLTAAERAAIAAPPPVVVFPTGAEPALVGVPDGTLWVEYTP